MVQIIPRTQKTFGEHFGAGLQRGVGGGLDMLQQLMGQAVQNKAQEPERKRISELIGQDVSSIKNPEMLKMLLQSKLSKEENADKLKGEYAADEGNYNKIKNAFGEKFADVWRASPTGARTALTQAALEARARGIDLDQILSMPQVQETLGINAHTQNAAQKFENPEEQQVYNELEQIKSGQDEGLLPEESIARGKERYATGLKEYQEAGTKLHTFARDKERLDILEDLNKSEKLPKGLGRVNVDLKEGNLRLPTLASPEAQRYIKTLNEFSAGAKDTFGSRVTNFDLAQYLKRFPTLLNTKEGRRQILDQMKLVNQINSVYYKNLKKVYDDAGGVRKIDSDVAERLAGKLSEPAVNKLSNKFKEIGQFSSRPNPAEFQGRRIQDEKTGEIFISDGNDWIPEGE